MADDTKIRSPAGTDSPDQETLPTPEQPKPAETGGPKGLEPTRYGDWEQNGRCTDF